MQLKDLSQDCLATIKAVRWDRIIEKHEEPEDLESVLRWYNPEFMEIEGRFVLLPVERDRHSNITILRTIWSAGQLSNPFSQRHHLRRRLVYKRLYGCLRSLCWTGLLPGHRLPRVVHHRSFPNLRKVAFKGLVVKVSSSHSDWDGKYDRMN